MGKPIVSITLAYAGGLLLGNGFLYFPYSTGVILLAALAGTTLLVILGGFPFRRFLIVVIPCSLGIAAYLYSAAWLPGNHYTRLVPLDHDLHDITGRVDSPPERDPDRTVFVLDIAEIDGKPVAGKMRVSIHEACPLLGYHDLIRISGKMYDPHGYNNPGGSDYRAFLARSGVYRTASVKDADRASVIAPGSGIIRTIYDWRERIHQALLASMSGPASAVIQAMIVGEKGGVTDEVREWFQAAGVAHILAISGAHLGMVAVLCFSLTRFFLRLLPERFYHRLTLYFDPRKAAAWITLPLVGFYMLLAGGQVSTVRSLIMITAGLAALVLDRENALTRSLAAAGLLILLASPQAIFDISFQLSFLSVYAIGYIALLWQELGIKSGTYFQKIRNNTSLMIAISFAASIATGPLTAYYFNQISFAGLISNMVVVPFAGFVVVPLGLFSGIASLFLGRLPLAWLNQAAGDLFVGTVSFFSRIPFADFHPAAPGIFWLFLYTILVASLAILLRMRLLYMIKPLEYPARASRAVVVAACVSGILLAVYTGHRFIPRENMEVCFPDVGQGDSELIRVPGGKTVLIDGGGTHDGRFDIGSRVLAPYLWNSGIRKLDLVISTHPEADHMNGLVYLLKKMDVGEVWINGEEKDTYGYHRFMYAIAERHILTRIKSSGDLPVQLGGAQLRVLYPALRSGRNEDEQVRGNDRSLVVQISYDGHVLLFTGDITKKAEKELVRSGAVKTCVLLKVPHHGSKSSSSEDFVSAAGPRLAAFSVGTENPYHHPAPEVVERYERHGAAICRTDRDGAFTVFFNRNGITAERWNDMILNRIDRGNRAAVWQQERENARRLWLRKWEF